ncbi:hypothetical protein, partial [Acinetobacter baumannii]|uniref:hypothetical protein n=1 Tax=Acinetobacter baumannii TaxID=470 RepID=UPI001BB40DCB
YKFFDVFRYIQKNIQDFFIFSNLNKKLSSMKKAQCRLTINSNFYLKLYSVTYRHKKGLNLLDLSLSALYDIIFSYIKLKYLVEMAGFELAYKIII